MRDGALWFSEAAGNRIGRITVDGKVTEFAIPNPDSQPRAMVTHPDGSIWFVETSSNALGRIDRDGKITEHPVRTPNASLRGVTVGAEATSGTRRILPTRSAAWRRTARSLANTTFRRRRAARAALLR